MTYILPKQPGATAPASTRTNGRRNQRTKAKRANKLFVSTNYLLAFDRAGRQSWNPVVGNDTDNVYVSAVMVKIMTVAQRDEKALCAHCPLMVVWSEQQRVFLDMHPGLNSFTEEYLRVV